MKRILVLASLFLFLMSSAALAKPQTYTATGEYVMSPKETLEDGIKHAREDALRLISESVGVYVESQSELKNEQLTQDEIKTMSSSIIRIVSETGPVVVQHGNGLDIKMTVTAEADADQLFTEQKKKSEDLNERLQSALYEAGLSFDSECRAEAQSMSNEISLLSSIMLGRDSQNQMTRGFAEKWDAVILLRQGEYDQAFDTLNRSIDIMRENPETLWITEGEAMLIAVDAADIYSRYFHDVQKATWFLRRAGTLDEVKTNVGYMVFPVDTYKQVQQNIQNLRAGKPPQDNVTNDLEFYIFYYEE